jgi:RHS repeat-associated protein
VRASGSNCTAFVDGVQIGGTQTITAHQTDTYHGLYVFQSTDHLFENFSVLAEADAEPVGWLGDPGYYTEAAVMRRLEYVRARWYQAGGPGWMSKDRLGLGGGDVNLYRYVKNRPLVAKDPSGLASNCAAASPAAKPQGSNIRDFNSCYYYWVYGQHRDPRATCRWCKQGHPVNVNCDSPVFNWTWNQVVKPPPVMLPVFPDGPIPKPSRFPEGYTDLECLLTCETLFAQSVNKFATCEGICRKVTERKCTELLRYCVTEAGEARNECGELYVELCIGKGTP